MTVTLTKTTEYILSNFSTINSSIIFKKGNTVRTISNAENILAKFTSEETWPIDFAIYDLGQFLQGCNILKTDPKDQVTLDFAAQDHVKISCRKRSVKYYFSDPEITLKSAPDKNVNFPGSDIEFEVSGTDVNSLWKASGVFLSPDLTFQSRNNDIRLILRDKENDTSNAYRIDVNGSCTGDYELDVKMENIRLVTGDYNVKVSKNLISEWKMLKSDRWIPEYSQDVNDLTYYVALEP